MMYRPIEKRSPERGCSYGDLLLRMVPISQGIPIPSRMEPVLTPRRLPIEASASELRAAAFYVEMREGTWVPTAIKVMPRTPGLMPITQLRSAETSASTIVIPAMAINAMIVQGQPFQ